MGFWDWIVLLLLGAAAAGAGYALHRRRGTGCDGNCACCSHCRNQR